MSLIVRDSNAHDFRLTISYALVQLTEWIQKKGYPLLLTLSARGYCVPSNPSLSEAPEPDTRPLLDSQYQILQIEGRLRSRGPEIRKEGCFIKYDPQTVECGWYKKPGFDAAYTALKALLPDLKEVDFATYGSCFWCTGDATPNPNLVEDRVIDGTQGCIFTYLRGHSQPEYYDFQITLPDGRLEALLEVLKEFLTEIEGDFLQKE